MRKIRRNFKNLQLTQPLRVAVVTMSLLFLSAGVIYSSVPDDQIPVPFEQLAFRNNVFDISGWPATKTLHSVWIEGDYLYFPNEGACSWASTDGIVNTNVHIILEYKGEWIASSWDYTRICQESKHYDAIGDIPYDGWKPQVGTTYYFFLTGVSRDYSGGDVQERTNVVKYEWFGPTGYPPPVCEGVPVINSFTATPNPVTYGDAGLLGVNKTHNVGLSWNISNGDRIRLDAATGESGETPEGYPVIDGVQLLLERTNTFTLTAENECTAPENWPSKTVTVKVTPPGLPGVNLLLLNKPAG